MEFTYDGGGLGKGGDVTLFVDGEPGGRGPGGRHGADGLLRRRDDRRRAPTRATPVSDDYTPKGSVFTGRVDWVQIDIDEAAEDLDHLITDEERYRVAMARQ